MSRQHFGCQPLPLGFCGHSSGSLLQKSGDMFIAQTKQIKKLVIIGFVVALMIASVLAGSIPSIRATPSLAGRLLALGHMGGFLI
jgi:hypothetical protein